MRATGPCRNNRSVGIICTTVICVYPVLDVRRVRDDHPYDIFLLTLLPSLLFQTKGSVNDSLRFVSVQLG
jgi:hypothetical protein